MFRNVQLHHLINLLVLLLLSKFYAYLYLDWREIIFLLIYALSIELVLSWIFYKEIKKYSFSAITTAIGIVLMVFSTQLWLYLLLILLSLLQKYLVKLNNSHLFNPSNFAIFTLLLFFDKFGGISSGTLGHSSYLWFVVILLGSIILIRVNRWLISIFFILFYLLFEYLLVVGYDSTLFIEDIIDRFYSVSFILFILFMLTDPATTPNKSFSQIVFVILISLFSAIFDRFYGVRVEHIFLSLTLLSPFGAMVERETKFWKILSVEIFILLMVIYTLQKPIIYIGLPN